MSEGRLVRKRKRESTLLTEARASFGRKKYKLSPRLVYPRHKLREAIKTFKLDEFTQKIEDQRCQADLMYALHWNPNQTHPILDQDGTKIGEGKEIDSVVEFCLEILERRYGNEPKKSSKVVNGIAYLRHPNTDHHIKLFFIYGMMRHEPEVKRLFLETFQKDSPGNLWGDRFQPHFNQFAHTMADYIEQTFSFPHNQGTIVQGIYNFIMVSKKLYLFN